MSTSRPLGLLCVMAATHGLYAQAFLREAKRAGHRVSVITRAEALGYDWPREAIDALYAVNDIFNPAELRNAVSYLARSERIDRLVGPGEYDIELAACLREHLRQPGPSQSATRFFRDKLAMRQGAAAAGVSVPEFVGAIHHPDVAAFLERVSGPWVLKPRTEASSKGIRVLRHPDEVWHALHELGDAASDHLLERFVAGSVFHVDGIVTGGQVAFAAPHRYGKPILELHSQGGVYTTNRLRRGSAEETALLALTREAVSALGHTDGVFHLEAIQGREDGRFYFLELGARVGAGLIEEMVEAHSGVNLWAEWARIEIAQAQGVTYEPPSTREGYAGVLACAVPTEHADPRPFLAPDVTYVPSKPYHLGLLVTGDDPEAVRARLDGLAEQIGRTLMVRL